MVATESPLDLADLLLPVSGSLPATPLAVHNPQASLSRQRSVITIIVIITGEDKVDS